MQDVRNMEQGYQVQHPVIAQPWDSDAFVADLLEKVEFAAERVYRDLTRVEYGAADARERMQAGARPTNDMDPNPLGHQLTGELVQHTAELHRLVEVAVIATSSQHVQDAYMKGVRKAKR